MRSGKWVRSFVGQYLGTRLLLFMIFSCLNGFLLLLWGAGKRASLPHNSGQTAPVGKEELPMRHFPTPF